MKEISAISDRKAADQQQKPYVGLRSFREDENHLFFGREEQVDELAGRLRRSRFLAVLGASGSGKSSLVMAGLLPALHGGYMVEAGSHWKVAVIRPGNAPLARLGEGLTRLIRERNENEQVVAPEKMVQTILRHSSRGLVDVARNMVLDQHDNLLIVVDQFEELFRFPPRSQGNEEALTFVRLLLNAGSQSRVPTYVIITMRSDFLGDCIRFPGLPEMINDGQYLVPRMSRENFRDAIVSPAAVFFKRISPPLETQLLNDVGDRLDQLPILQHALMRTWDHWLEDTGGNGPVLLQHYLAAGGMENALDLHAEEIFTELGTERLQKVCERVFRTITTKGSDNRGIRRPTPFADICTIAEADPDEVHSVIEAFRKPGRSFILPAPPHSLHSETVIDISHESFMRVWKRLVKWVEEEVDSEAMYLRIREAMLLYLQDKAGLWRPPELHLATAWLEKENPTEIWADRLGGDFPETMDFIANSDATYTAELEEKERERRSKLRRARIFAIVLAIAALISIALSVFAMQARKEADQQREVAELREREAKAARDAALAARKTAEDSTASAVRSRILASEQAEIAREQRGNALQQRMLALIAKDSAVQARSRADANAIEAKRQSEIAKENEKVALTNEQTAQEQREKAVAARNQTERLRMLSIARSMAVKSAIQKEDPQLKGLLAYQAWQFNQENKGAAHDPDLYAALYEARKALTRPGFNVVRRLPGSVRGLATQPGSDLLLTRGGAGEVALGKAGEQAKIIFEDNSPIRGAQFLPGTSWIVIGEERGTIYLIDKDQNPNPPAPLLQLAGSLHDLVLLPGSNLIAAGGDRGKLSLINLGSGKVEHASDAGGSIREIALIEGQKLLLVCNDRGEIRAFSAALPDTSETIYPIKEGQSPAHCMAISPDEKTMAIGTQAGEILLLPIAEGGLNGTLQGHTQMVNQLCYSPSGQYLASAGNDRTARLWTMAAPGSVPIALTDHADWVWSVGFSQDGGTLYTGCADGLVKAFPLSLDALADKFCNGLDRDLTEREWQSYIPDVPYRSTCQEK